MCAWECLITYICTSNKEILSSSGAENTAVRGYVQSTKRSRAESGVIHICTRRCVNVAADGAEENVGILAIIFSSLHSQFRLNLARWRVWLRADENN